MQPWSFQDGTIKMKPLNVVKSSIIRPGSDPDWKAEVPKRMRMRESRIWCMAHAAIKLLLSDTDLQPRSIIVATALGALEDTREFLDGLFADGFGSPRNFIASVHNSMAGKLALDFNIKGPNLTVCDGQNSFASALVSASLLLPSEFPVIILGIDEKIQLLDRIAPHITESCREYLNVEWEEAAIGFLLDNSADRGMPTICSVSPRPDNDDSPEDSFKELAKSFENNPALMPLSETSDSFIKPAIIAHELLSQSKTGNHVIGSYSPTSRATAAIYLCI